MLSNDWSTGVEDGDDAESDMNAGEQIRFNNIIVVEGDLLTAAWLSDALRELGQGVDGIYHDTASAFAAFHCLNFSLYHPIVILDGDLDKGGSEVIARFLANKGVQFILHTDQKLDDSAFRNMMFSVLPKDRDKISLVEVLEYL